MAIGSSLRLKVRVSYSATAARVPFITSEADSRSFSLSAWHEPL